MAMALYFHLTSEGIYYPEAGVGRWSGGVKKKKKGEKKQP